MFDRSDKGQVTSRKGCISQVALWLVCRRLAKRGMLKGRTL